MGDASDKVEQEGGLRGIMLDAVRSSVAEIEVSLRSNHQQLLVRLEAQERILLSLVASGQLARAVQVGQQGSEFGGRSQDLVSNLVDGDSVGADIPLQRASLGADAEATSSLRFQRVMTQQSQMSLAEVELATRSNKRNLSSNATRDLTAMAMKQGGRERLAVRLTKNIYFDALFGVLVVLNGFLIGIEVEYQTENETEHTLLAFAVLSNTVSALFCVEMVLRLLADRLEFFVGRTWAWNIFDALMVLGWFCQLYIDYVLRRSEMSTFSTLRLVRILRITRLVRLLRIARIVRVVRALRVLIHAIVDTLKSVMWAMALLLGIIYFFAVMFTQATNSYLIQEDGCRSEQCDGWTRDLWGSWGTVPRSVYTLYQCITGGIDWNVAADPLSKVGQFWLMSLIFYITFVTIAVLNVVTGIFVQSAINSAQRDREHVISTLMKERDTHITNIREQFCKMFQRIDSDRSGTISVEEFEQHMCDDKASGFFLLLDIDANEAWSLFKLLDDDGSGWIDAEEFVDGCLRLQGNARSIDLAKMRHESKSMMQKLADQISHADDMLAHIASSSTAALEALLQRTKADSVGLNSMHEASKEPPRAVVLRPALSCLPHCRPIHEREAAKGLDNNGAPSG